MEPAVFLLQLTDFNGLFYKETMLSALILIRAKADIRKAFLQNQRLRNMIYFAHQGGNLWRKGNGMVDHLSPLEMFSKMSAFGRKKTNGRSCVSLFTFLCFTQRDDSRCYPLTTPSINYLGKKQRSAPSH